MLLSLTALQIWAVMLLSTSSSLFPHCCSHSRHKGLMQRCNTADTEGDCTVGLRDCPALDTRQARAFDRHTATSAAGRPRLAMDTGRRRERALQGLWAQDAWCSSSASAPWFQWLCIQLVGVQNVCPDAVLRCFSIFSWRCTHRFLNLHILSGF